MRGRLLGSILAAALALAGLVSSAAAQTYPDKVVRIIVPFSSGGVTDVVARAFGKRKIAVKTGVKVDGVDTNAGGAVVRYEERGTAATLEVDLVVVSEGYTADEMTKFYDQATKFAASFLAGESYGENAPYFNDFVWLCMLRIWINVYLAFLWC